MGIYLYVFLAVFAMKTVKAPAYQRDDFLPTVMQIFTFAKWFGIPVYGGKIALFSAIAIFILLFTIEVGAVWKLIRLLAGLSIDINETRGIVNRLSGTMFYGNALCSFMLTWRLIASWRKTSIIWMRAETTTGLYFSPDTKIRKRVIFVTVLVSTCAFVEHAMSMSSNIKMGGSLYEVLRMYLLMSHGFLIHSYDYSLWLAIPIFMLSKIATILWNFQDLVIILISMGLTSRYHRLNMCVKNIAKLERRNKTKKFGSEMYFQIYTWRKLREAFVRQAALVKRVDKDLGPLVLLSNLNNFFFICLQLFLGINKHEGNLKDRFYYFLSLGWLMFRACSVVLAAADVNVHSKRALPYLYICPGTSYNIEIRRLRNQLTYDTVALSGMGFFMIERHILLEVAAAIVKYELVLLQYDK